MKRLLVVMIGLGLATAACNALRITSATATVPATQSPTDVPVLATPTHIPVDLSPAQRAAMSDLAQSLGVPVSEVNLVSTEAVTWPNGCMGVPRVGALCTQGQVPGYRLVLSAKGQQYEYHTNLDGSIIVPSEAMQVPGPAETAAIKQFVKNLGISESDVKLVSGAPVEWPDSCLGVALDHVMCAQIVTPGYIIVLEAGDKQYEYHTNNDASVIMPATPAMDWKQEGGIAGVCQSITVYLSGEVYGMNCAAGGDGRMAVLTSAQRQQLYTWIDTLANTAVDLSDPKGAADAMTRTADLMSGGTMPPTDAQKHAIFDFGQALYRQLYH